MALISIMMESENDDLVDTLDGNKFFSVSFAESGKDWSVSEDFRFVSLFHLMDGNILPDPALTGENGEYIFNRTGIDAIRKELVRGRGVAVSFYADQSLPGQEIGEDAMYIKFSDKDGNPSENTMADIWAQYSYDTEYDPSDPDSVNQTLSSNHVVCIVGYDDNFPKEFFYDPNGTIGGDGAFLAKNS